MTTPYSDIYDLFLQQIKDWKLDALYTADPMDFEVYLEGFLVLSLPSFLEHCDQDLTRDDSTRIFTETLTDENKVILSMKMTEQWLMKEVQDIRQMNLHVTDKDFKTFSEAQNLREKSNYLITIRERISQAVTEYSWYNNDWTSWIAGEFLGG